MFDLTFYLVMTVAVIILGLSKGGFAGVGMVSTPMVAAVTDPVTAAGIMLPIMLVQDPVAVVMYRRSFDRKILVKLIPGGVLGVLLAFSLAASVPEWGLKIVLGLISLAFSSWQAFVYLRGIQPQSLQYRFDSLMAFLAGVGSGFSSSIAHAGSPPFQIYAMPKQLPKEIYVGTSVMFFASVNLMKLPSFIALDVLKSENLLKSAAFIPLAVVSSWAGAWLVRRVKTQNFNLIVTGILLFISMVLLWQGVSEYRVP